MNQMIILLFLTHRELVYCHLVLFGELYTGIEVQT